MKNLYKIQATVIRRLLLLNLTVGLEYVKLSTMWQSQFLF